MEFDPTLKVKEVAEILRVTPWQVYEMARQGRLPVVHVGRAVRIPRKEFTEWMSKGGEKAGRNTYAIRFLANH